MKTVLVIALLLLTCCGLIPEKVSLDDPKVQPLLMAAAKFDRIAHGFSPIPRVGDVRLELATGRPYDAMLHIYTKTSKTIAFKKSGNEYVWIAEQEIFVGPKQFKTPDGTLHESITLDYQVEEMSDIPIDKLCVSYTGEDGRLNMRSDLTLKDVSSILKEWGY